MPAFYLFRLKAIRSKQSPLFKSDVTRREFIEALLEEKPSAEIRAGYVWHIGNVRKIKKDGLIFAVGRTTKSNKEQFDETSGDFKEIIDVESPFTYAVYDSKYSVIAIALKTKLSPTAKGIARSLQTLLNGHSYTRDNEIRIEIAEISDPEGFIEQILKAYSVVEFSLEFTEPNPFDVEKDFHEPMEKLLEETGGEKGKTKIQGEELDKEILEELSRSAASTGNDVSAKLKKEEDQKPVTRHMKGDLVSVSVEDQNIPEQAEQILSQTRNTYLSVRGSEEE